MYTSYADYMGWENDVTDYETTDIGMFMCCAETGVVDIYITG